MYSKSKGMTDREYCLTPPPGYDGSRFRRRSDGRDDAFPLYQESPPSPPRKRKGFSHKPLQGEERHRQDVCDPVEITDDVSDTLPYCDEECGGCAENCDVCDNDVCDSEKKDTCQKKDNSIADFLNGLPGEEILLIALIVLLAGDNKASIDTVLILALLLCIS